jgi:predicted protein tyrosine phosphatase
MSDSAKTNLLFVCSRNRWRSPTAEALFRDHPRYAARSAGTEKNARVKVTAGHLSWADRIFCMERKHADRLHERFGEILMAKPPVILRIRDDYDFMDEALVSLLRESLAVHLEL